MLKIFRRKADDPLAELKEMLGDFELRSFPSAVVNVLGMLRDGETPLPEIAGQIEMDPGMTVKVLRLVNSAGFGLAKQVSSLQHAVSLLGRSRLESLLLTYAAADSLPATIECMDAGLFWTAAARRGCLARAVAQHLHAGTEAEAFTAGLLQDMGVPALANAKGAEYTVVLDAWHGQPGRHLDELEREAFGYDHATVGALMAEEWGLPDYLIDAIAGHHGGGAEATAQPAIRLVSHIRYFDGEEGGAVLTSTAESDFGIDGALMEEMVGRSFAEADELAGMFYR